MKELIFAGGREARFAGVTTRSVVAEKEEKEPL